MTSKGIFAVIIAIVQGIANFVRRL